MVPKISVRLVLMLMLFPMFGYAQKNDITVKTFYKDENNTIPIVDKVLDQLNKPCALIIVRNVDVGGFSFDAGNNYIIAKDDADTHGKLIKVWISSSAKRITIRNVDKGIGALNNYVFSPPLEEGKAYRMELGPVFSTDNNGRQYVNFTITPDDADAYLEVEDVPWALNQGKASKALGVGTYNYHISAEDYHDEYGQFTVDPVKPLDIDVKLRHNYGFLTVKGTDLAEADIYIDGKKYALNQLTLCKLPSGQHVLKITKNLYLPYEQKFEIADDKESILMPMLEGNYSTVNISAPDGAAILINGKAVGVGNATTHLGEGKYIVEVRKQGYHSEQWQLNVSQINQTYTKTFTNMDPIYGAIDIQSEPSGAMIAIDGVSIGRTTPYSLSNVLIGDHQVQLTLDGYQPYETKVTVVENEPQEVKAELSNMVELTIKFSPEEAYLTIDGKMESTKSPKTIMVTPGTTVNVKLEKHGYYDYEYNLKVDKNQTLEVKMKRPEDDWKDYYGWGRPDGSRYEWTRFFYFSVNYAFGDISSVGGCLGFQVGCFNMQFDCGYCLSEGFFASEYEPNGRTYAYLGTHRLMPNLYYGGKTGLAVTAAMFNITAQVGYRQLDLRDTYVGHGTVGIRIQIRTSEKFAFIVNPEYYFPVVEGKLFKKAYEELPEATKLGTGIQVGVGFDIYF